MNIFRSLFSPSPDLPFSVGDRVRDTFGHRHTVIAVDPRAEHGAGLIRTRRDDGQELGYLFYAHDLILLTPAELALPGRQEIKCERINPDESSATAYLRADAIILHAQCPTNMGGLACLPCRRLPLPVTDDILGTSSLAILGEAITVPVPVDHKAELKRILQHAKITSWRKLIVESASCSIRSTPASLTITPSQRQGSASHHLPELAIELATPTAPAEIAQALRTAFQRCV